MQYISNPNPIQITKEERKEVDKIISMMIKKFHDWWKKGLRGKIGNSVLAQTTFKVKRFHKGEDTVEAKIVGTSARVWAYTGLWGIPQAYVTHSTPIRLVVNINGHVRKDQPYSQMMNQPFTFWVNMQIFKAVLLHEIIHTKDPVLSKKTMYGTSLMNKKFDFTAYINDPSRAEFRAHLAEWDSLTSEWQKVLEAKEGDKDWEISKAVRPHLIKFLCKFIAREKADRNKYFIDRLTNKASSNFGMSEDFIPDWITQQIIYNKKFHDYPDRKVRKMIDVYEQAEFGAGLNIRVTAPMREYKANQIKREDLRRKLVQKYTKKYPNKNLGQITKMVKVEVDKQHPKIKKPTRKTEFTARERKQMMDYKNRNFPEMISAIYSMFEKKGLFDLENCVEYFQERERRLPGDELAEIPDTIKKLLKKKELGVRKSRILTKLDKLVIQNLSQRFKGIK